MSVLHGNISWNEIKKIVEEKIGGGMKVKGDGEVVRMGNSQLVAINVQDGTEAYYGTLYINSFHGNDVKTLLYDSVGTPITTLNITVPTSDFPTKIENLIFNAVDTIYATDGFAHFVGYKLTLS